MQGTWYYPHTLLTLVDSTLVDSYTERASWDALWVDIGGPSPVPRLNHHIMDYQHVKLLLLDFDKYA